MPERGTETPAEPKRMIVLESSDGKRFTVEQALAAQSEIIKNMIPDDEGVVLPPVPLPLPTITGAVLAKVIQYWELHAAGASEEELKRWFADFADPGKEKAMAFGVAQAAHDLIVPPLFDMATKLLFDHVHAMPRDQIIGYLGFVDGHGD